LVFGNSLQEELRLKQNIKMTPTVSVLLVIIGFALVILVGSMVPQSSAKIPKGKGRGRGSKWW